MPTTRHPFANVVGVKHVTDSALASTLATLRDEGHLSSGASGISRRNLKRQAEQSVLTPTVYGELIQTLKVAPQ